MHLLMHVRMHLRTYMRKHVLMPLIMQVCEPAIALRICMHAPRHSLGIASVSHAATHLKPCKLADFQTHNLQSCKVTTPLAHSLGIAYVGAASPRSRRRERLPPRGCP